MQSHWKSNQKRETECQEWNWNFNWFPLNRSVFPATIIIISSLLWTPNLSVINFHHHPISLIVRISDSFIYYGSYYLPVTINTLRYHICVSIGKQKYTFNQKSIDLRLVTNTNCSRNKFDLIKHSCIMEVDICECVGSWSAGSDCGGGWGQE